MPHHQARLAMGLQADETVGYMDSRLLERTRPLDVGLFVEAGLDFDQRDTCFPAAAASISAPHDR